MNRGRKSGLLLRPFSFAWSLCVLATGLQLVSSPAAAEVQRTVSETATVARAVDGDTLVLKDGRRVRVDGINTLEIPHKSEDAMRCLPSTRRAKTNDKYDDFGCDLTLAHEAQVLVSTLTVNKAVTLRFNPERREDRFGRLLTEVWVNDRQGQEVSVAAALVHAGLAHVYPLTGQEIGTTKLLPLEEEARMAKRGIWQLPELQPTDAAQAATQYGHYALITGTVVQAAKVKTKIYLNFGAAYHTDFTAVIDKRDWKNFPSLDVLALTGKRVLVRGYLYEAYGPAMRLSNEGQISLLP
ncbi:MAG: thermonuclease family protein [Alphaproteobacteria bacterium]|nr:thermonuclease family protein [Alphaproteobacteria bacterium]